MWCLPGRSRRILRHCQLCPVHPGTAGQAHSQRAGGAGPGLTGNEDSDWSHRCWPECPTRWSGVQDIEDTK